MVERAREIGESLALALVQVAGYLVDHDIPAPAVFHGGAQIPIPGRSVFDPIEQNPQMTPDNSPQAVARLRGPANLQPGCAYISSFGY